jgi:4-amino-4-deoxy-L-arabinose transferase-like glycosyltransferase
MTGQTSHYKDRKAWIYWITLALFAGFLFLFGLGNHPLLGSDENRVAGIATGMAISGDLVVPRLNGEPFLEKPPMYFWIASACYNLCGNNFYAARLPSAIAAICSVLLVFFVARKTGFSEFTAFISAIILATSTGFWSLGRECMIDMTLCLFTTSAMACFYQYSRFLPKITLWYIGFILSLSCAVLTKGLVGLAIPLSALSVWLLLQKDFSYRNWALLLIGSLLCLIPIGIWIYCLQNNLGWDAVYEVVWANNFGRFASAYGGHNKPFYYYIINFPKHFIPWVLFLPFAVVYHFRETRAWKEKSGPVFFLFWLGVPFILLSISSGKRGLYLLPLYPAAALFVGSAVGRVLESRNTAKKLFTVPSVILGWLIVIVSAGFCVISIYLKQPFITSLFVCLPGLCLGFWACKKLYGKDPTGFFKVITAALGVLFLTYSTGMLPLLKKGESYKPAFDYFENLSANGNRINFFKPSERIKGAAVFYLKRNIPVINKEENLKAFLFSGEKAVAVTVTGKKETLNIQSVKILNSFDVGSWKVVFLINHNSNFALYNLSKGGEG